jgi:citrate lyase subunit beta/citryl-CoA lyase
VRSKLFVPGTRPELFEKAMNSGADAVTFDLEDAVTIERKSEARANVAAFVRQPRQGGPLVIVRLNARHTPFYEEDLSGMMLAGVDMLNVPKIEQAEDVTIVADRMAKIETERNIAKPIGILANIETPRGVRMAADIAAASDRIKGLQLGFGDLFEPYGISRTGMAPDMIRLTVRFAAAESGVPVYDGAFPAVADVEGFRAEAESARRLGLSGKSCIHPTQIAMANEVFFPSAREIADARKIVDAAEEKFAGGMGAFVMDGVMIDEPYVVRARALLRLADERTA